MKELKSAIFRFMLTGIVTTILSVLAMVIFRMTGLYVIHPVIYILTLMMGIGWTATAITSYFNIRKRINNFDT